MPGKSRQTKTKQASMQRNADAGWQAIQLADFPAAEEAYLKALKAARQLADRQAEAVFLSYLGLARHSQGKKAEAREDLLACLQLATEDGLARIEAHALLLIGEQDREAGDSTAAIQRFMRALEAAIDCQDDMAAEMAFGNLGLLYLERGWLEQASECFRQALDLSDTSPNRSAWLGSLGQSLAEMGELGEAVDCYIQAYEEAGRQGNTVAQAICRGSQGNAHFELGEFKEALDCYQEALRLSGAAQDAVRAGVWLGNLGNVYRRLGDPDRATATCEKALQIARDLKDSHAEAAHLDSLGDCYAAKGDLDKAMNYYQQALEISQTIVDRQGQRIYLSNLGRTHQRLGQLAPAFEYFSRAIELFDEQRARIKSDDLKTSFAARGQELYADMVQVCLALNKRVDALEYVGRAKSRAILDLLSNSPIDISELAGGDDQSLKKLIARESQLRNQIARLEQLFWQGSTAGEGGHRGAVLAPEDTRKIYSEWRSTIDQLKRRHPNYANLITVEALSFPEIKALWPAPSGKGREKHAGLLAPNVAILEYYWTDQYLLAAALWQGCEEPATSFLTDADALIALEADVADFLEMSATEGWEVPLSLCQRLYARLMAPLLASIPSHVERLILVPHGTLYHLPFSALYDGGQFLIERYALSYLPTTSLIPVLAGTAIKPGDDAERPRYLVSAISDYSATRREGLPLTSRMRSAAGLDDLSHTMEEAATVYDVGSQHAREARLITNAEVKEALPALFGEYPVIHFAGHAVFNPDEPMASGLVLSDGSVLSAASILQGNILRTRRGKLLVLSACQTGVNMVTPGGEILGLARALMYAGMPNLILSLWEVADRSTAALMQGFHRSWQAGQVPIARALQEAQVKALKERQPVHAWAPFIHMGIA